MHATRAGRTPVVARIDIVYLWVDGADESWQARRRLAMSTGRPASIGDLALHGDVLGRYRDNGELRFNLRALERFFPDHGHIYVVTDRQRPSWLQDGPGLSVIDHHDLLPASSRPTFNSGNIESWIHHIPGLSEKFFYLNDDTFFGAPVDVDAWFGGRLAVPMVASTTVQRPDTELRADVEDAVNGAIASARWLGRRHADYRHDPRLPAHAPRPLLRSAMFELERLAPEAFHDLRSTAFRSWRTPAIVPGLLVRWMMHIGLARPVETDALYILSGDPQVDPAYAALSTSFGRLPFFCINDSCDDAPADDPRLGRVARELAALLPRPSSFERSDSRVDERPDGSMHGRWRRRDRSPEARPTAG